ncbi:molybdate ABC transporter substrate-binding protein [Chthonobacter rhizosphaerae]|uniref:molybdate ABC transporter substrate-binding protein n=1 Tax=Chthonobacter rhizosphaerae TaxID=2735553 RepID=UPI0015EFA62A|nr:molybdate ABC transporter substrate-binding protein [Chthonobacter rhizosphaerae]
MLALAAGLAMVAGHAPARAETVTVFAAASLKTVLDDLATVFQDKTGTEVTASYAASSALAKQIEQGAPADVFISADLAWMDYLTERSLIRTETRSNLIGNSLVLVTAKDSPVTLTIEDGFDLSGALAGGRLAVGEVTAVPAGKYAKAALEALGAWDAVSGSLAEAENVRVALLLVSRGEAALGIVYATDAAADPGVMVVDTFPADSHPPIVYPVAVTAEADSPAAAAYVDFLAGPEAQAAFEAAGFSVLQAGN